MTADTFWNLIEQSGTDMDVQASRLHDLLIALPPEEIGDFQSRFSTLFAGAYDWNLWGAAYLIGGGCSDDGFMDFRYWLISRGKSIYQSALANADSLADMALDDDVFFEEFGYVARKAYKKKAGTDAPRDSVVYSKEPTGESWDFDDASEVRLRLPRLANKFLDS